MELSDAIKQYRFSLLPPRIQSKDAEPTRKKKEETGRYDVQCQVCGRMGAMTIEEMKKHAEGHVDETTI